MNPERVVRSEVKTLTDLPNVGPAIAGQLATIGICTPAELRGREPLELFEALCARSGRRLDPCLLDVLLSIADFIDGGDPRCWWAYTDMRKQRYGRSLEAGKAGKDT